MKPVLFVTGHAPFDRVGAFTRLHEREDVEFVLFGGRSQHGGPSSPRDLPSSTHNALEATPVPAGRPDDANSEPAGRPDDANSEPAGRPDDANSKPAGRPDDELPFPHRHVRQREIAALAASGRHRAVVVSTGGRIALPGAWAGARRAGVPLILWTSLWSHPRTAAHLFSYAALRRLYRSAEAVVTYGPHVSAYVRARGARNVHVALQSVDNGFWGAPTVSPPAIPGWPSEMAVKFLFAGRPVREKGIGVLTEAWLQSGLVAPAAALVLVGVGPAPPWVPAGGAVGGSDGQERVREILRTSVGRMGRARTRTGDAPENRDTPDAGLRNAVRLEPRNAVRSEPRNVVCLEPIPAVQLRELYAAADVLVVPSIPTRTFREPWGLVVNEAMNRNLPVIASDAVGAAAGGLVRDGRNGLVVPAKDPQALAHALRRLAEDQPLRARLGAAGARDVQAFTHDAWAQGFSDALGSLGLSRGGRW
jgi:glycosyltransferase involved in cell wall biosynthesis